MIIDPCIFDEVIENGTPLPGNICKDVTCGGRVTKSVSSIYRGNWYYHPPCCERCGRRYVYAKNVSVAGEKEFTTLINTSFTI